MNRKEFKDLVKELMNELQKEEIAKFRETIKDNCNTVTDNDQLRDCWVEKNEWPKQGDEYWFINSFGNIEHDRWSDGRASVFSKRYNSGSAYETKEEAEAVRDLRKHEAKCRFTMEDFEEGNWYYFTDDVTGDPISHIDRSLPCYVDIMFNKAFPNRKMAEERLELLERLAKIRGLI